MTHFKRILSISLLLTVLLSGCGLPASPTYLPPSENQIATEVANMLTASPAPTQPALATPISPVVTATLPPEQAQPTATSTSLPPTATATQEPTATQAPTATTPPQPTATLSPKDPRATLGDPTFIDNTFKEGQNWGSAWKDDYTQGEFSNHHLLLTSVGVDGWTVTWPKLSDLYVEMTAETGECGGMDRYGLIVRVPKTFDSGYLFGVTCDGQYSLRVWNPDKKKYEYLIPWTSSSAINAGSNQTNRLGIMAVGDRLSVYVNGKLLGEATDSRFDKGQFGPFIGHDETTDFTITITEIAAWDLS